MLLLTSTQISPIVNLSLIQPRLWHFCKPQDCLDKRD